MILVKTYPSNKKFFIRLKAFCKEILDICKELGVTPIAYGSLVYLGYIKGEKIVVNDIDLYIKESSFEKIIKALKKKKIRYKYSTKWHTIEIFKGGLKIYLDAIGYWYKGPKDFKDFDFDGLRVKGLSLEALKRVYKRAARVSDRPEENRRKFEILRNKKY